MNKGDIIKILKGHNIKAIADATNEDIITIINDSEISAIADSIFEKVMSERTQIGVSVSCTNVKDINGNVIYVGDIIKDLDYLDFPFEENWNEEDVIWRNENPTYCIVEEERGEFYAGSFLLSDYKKMEIVSVPVYYNFSPELKKQLGRL